MLLTGGFSQGVNNVMRGLKNIGDNAIAFNQPLVCPAQKPGREDRCREEKIYYSGW